MRINSSTNTEAKDYRTRIITIPNVLSLFRLLLIPIMMYLYIDYKNYGLTLLILILSGITDIADGIIARKFNMVSNFGKVFDPIADKLTQMAMLFCLVCRFSHMVIPLVLMIAKEVFTGITALISIKKTNTVKGAVWHGKLTTVSLYVIIGIHLVWYNIPRPLSLILVGFCLGIMLMSFIMYTVRYFKAIRTKTFED